MPRTLSLSFELLETVVALVRAGGDASAAMRALKINQPSLSKRLKHLQHAGPLLKRPWLVRQGKTWELTEEGNRVWPAVCELVDRYENLEGFLQGEPSAAAVVRFGCGQQMAAGLVRKALAVFRRKQPTGRVRISTMRGEARIEGVSNGSLDLAIVTHDISSITDIARRPLHAEHFASHGLVVACAQASPWSRRLRTLSPHVLPAPALTEFPLILPEPDAGIRKTIDEALRREGLYHKLNITLEVGGWPTLLAYVRDGFGVGVVSAAALYERKGLTVRPLDPAVFAPSDVKLVCRRIAGSTDTLDLTPEAAAWRDVLLRVAARG